MLRYNYNRSEMTAYEWHCWFKKLWWIQHIVVGKCSEE